MDTAQSNFASVWWIDRTGMVPKQATYTNVHSKNGEVVRHNEGGGAIAKGQFINYSMSFILFNAPQKPVWIICS